MNPVITPALQIKRLQQLLLVAAVASILCAGCETSQTKLISRAKISRDEAERTALRKVSGGSVKEGELEKEHGKLIWSFDIAQPGSSDITEVQVDAQTGDIVSVANETPAQQAREKKER